MTSNFSNNSHPPIAASELREDPITGRTTVIAAGRADRPAAFTAPDRTATPGSSGGPGHAWRVCPFDEGNEAMTPPEVWADRDPGTAPDTPGWHVRVIPNKYPAFTPGRTGAAAGGNRVPDGLPGRGRRADGVHEVVVHGPDHRRSLTELPEATLVAVVSAWRRRLAELRRAWPGAVTLITNQGRDAGASLEHSHSQVCATSFRPALIATEAERLAGRACAACAMVGRERDLGVRMVDEHEGLVALCPWASITPMEALLLPAEHEARFEAGGADPTASARALALALTGLLRRLTGAVGFEPAVNVVVHSAPPGVEDFHWHLHAYPRLTIPAGFELGTGTMINVVDPDHAAARLRAAAVPASSR